MTKGLLRLALFLLLAVSSASASGVIFDAVGPSASGTNSTSGSASWTTFTLSWTHTVGSGSNRLLVVGANLYPENTAIATLSATCNGTTMRTAGSQAGGSTANMGIAYLFYLVNPPSGSNSIVVTATYVSGTRGSGDELDGGSTSFTGVSQSQPIRNVTTVYGNDSISPISINVTSATGDMVVDVLGGQVYAGDIDSSLQTLRWESNSNAADVDQSTAPGGNSVTMGYNTEEQDAPYAIVAMDIESSTAVPSLWWLANDNATAGQGTVPMVNQLTNPSLIVVILLNEHNTNTQTPTDTAGNTYHDSGAGAVPYPNSDSNGVIQIWYALNTHTTSSNVVTVGTNGWYEVCEWVGGATSNPVDVYSYTENQTGTNVTSGSATTTVGSDLILGAGMTEDDLSLLGAGFTTLKITIPTADLHDSTEYLIQSSAGPVAATWTTSSSATYGALMVAFKLAGTPPPVVPKFHLLGVGP